jgi:hypothetical protein
VSGACFRTRTIYVRVRDPAGVALIAAHHAGKEEILAPGERSDSALFGHGFYYVNRYERRMYRIFASRGSSGDLLLQCEACARVDRSVDAGEVRLVASTGEMHPSAERPILRPDSLGLWFRLSWGNWDRSSKIGRIETLVILGTTWDNIVEARRRSVPVRAWGGVSTALGLILVASGTYASTRAGAPPFVTGSWTDTGVPLVSIGFLALGGSLVGSGLWHLLAPAREETISRPAP